MEREEDDGGVVGETFMDYVSFFNTSMSSYHGLLFPSDAELIQDSTLHLWLWVWEWEWK